MATTTFSENGATYTVRALTLDENQMVINIAIDLLWQIAQQRGWKVTFENRHQSRSYPYSVYQEAVNYAGHFLATRIDGDPSHTMPASILEAIDPAVFEQWSKDMQRNPELRGRWDTAWTEANKVQTDPEASSGESQPGSS